MIRPEVLAALGRWQEVLTGGGIMVAGLWLFTWGGWFFAAVGGLTLLGGAAWLVQGLRRMRFRQSTLGEGVVDVLEGQISYLSPMRGGGGFVALTEMTEVRLLRIRGHAAWRLAQVGRSPLLIPVDALGAERLFDVFAGLPGLDMPALLAALEDDSVTDRLIWRRPRHRVAAPPRARGFDGGGGPTP